MILLMAEILRHPTICGVLYIPGGAGFLPSTLGSYLFFSGCDLLFQAMNASIIEM